MMNITELHQKNTPKIVRILNGVLNGCEFIIESSRVLVIVDSSYANDELSSLDELPSDTIFLPTNSKGINFEVLFDEQNEDELTVRELSSKGGFERKNKYNNIIEVGDVVFAVKHNDNEWSPLVLNLQIEERKKKKPGLSLLRKNYIVIFTLMTATFLALIVVSMNIYNSEQNYMRRISGILANRELLFSEGRDHKLYVIAPDHHKAIWANQVIERGDFSTSRVKVISPEYEAQRIYRWLADKYPDIQYFRLQLGHSLVPILLISKERTVLSIEQNEKLKEDMMRYIPYAKDIDIKSVSDQLLVMHADEGLGSLGVKYTKTKVGNFYSYQINGELNDSEIIRLKYFLNEFYRQWGTEFIVFNVSLEKDELRNKTYLTGGDELNYIKTTPKMWTFSKTE